MPEFIPGLELSRLFFADAVQPILEKEFSGLPYSAARLGSGSDVLGYDTPLSRDHDWGPRLQLFLNREDHKNLSAEINELLCRQLPKKVHGYSTHFTDPDQEGSRLLAETDGPVNHRVEIVTVPQFFTEYMAYDDPSQEPTVYQWLTWPQQHLLGVTTGQVFHDGLGQLEAVRARLQYYPQDVWLYLLAAQWSRIGQEEHFVGRTGDVGDELGSRILATRLVHDIMFLCFLMEKTYTPYPKWFGTAFSRLQSAEVLTPLLHRVMAAEKWPKRETYLCQAYEIVAAMHNRLGITEPLPEVVTFFHNRPYRIINAGRFVDALRAHIGDPLVKQIGTAVGSIDQFSHSTDLRSYPRLHKRLESLYK